MYLAIHTITLIILVLANGGRHDWAYNFGALLLCMHAVPVTAELIKNRARIHRLGPKFWIFAVILPWTAFSVLFACSLFNPSFLTIYNNLFSPLLPIEYNSSLPTTPNPARSLLFLEFTIGLLFMTLSVLITKTTRRQIRACLSGLLIFGSFLAVTGALVKLTGSQQFLWAIEFREPVAFATFFYKNHWAYFALLIASIGIALIQYNHNCEKNNGHIPEKSIAYALCTVVVLVSIPLAQARAATLASIPLALVFIYVVTRWLPSRIPRIATALIFVVLAGIGTWFMSQMVAPQFAQALERSEQQIENYKAKDFKSVKRIALYRDSWIMFKEKPIWGWGVGSFIHIHPIYAGPEFYKKDSDYPVAYEFAHSDYLQTLAEKGIVGSTLLVIPFALLGIFLSAKARWKNPISPSLLLGSGLVLLTAAIDFSLSSPAIAMGTVLLLALGVRYALLSRRAENKTQSS